MERYGHGAPIRMESLETERTKKKCVAQEIPGLTNVIHIAAGTKHAMAMKKDGSVWLWGSNDHGQLGERSVIARNQPYPCFQVG